MYIAGVYRHHNAGVCLLKDGEIVFHTEEERLTRLKYDSQPMLGMNLISDYLGKDQGGVKVIRPCFLRLVFRTLLLLVIEIIELIFLYTK
jgi:predicted NodU family carbamoyl transferase